MPTLSVMFHGICSHFMGVVPGVPHRVVLPEAAAIRFELLDFAGERSSGKPYFLLPHMALVTSDAPDSRARFELKGSMKDGLIFSGVRMQVANAIDPVITYQDLQLLPRLTQFVEDYVPSEEVVLGGRAMCYFDIFGGNLLVHTFANSTVVTATFETREEPELLVTPFLSSQTPEDTPVRNRIALGSGDVHLHVTNLGIQCLEGDQRFDFLLHYLTGKQGIPRVLTSPPPGMIEVEGPTIGREQLAAALAAMPELDTPRSAELAERALQRKLTVIDDTSPACSNSGYP